MYSLHVNIPQSIKYFIEKYVMTSYHTRDRYLHWPLETCLFPIPLVLLSMTRKIYMCIK